MGVAIAVFVLMNLVVLLCLLLWPPSGGLGLTPGTDEEFMLAVTCCG